MMQKYAGKAFRHAASVMGTRMTQKARIKADGGRVCRKGFLVRDGKKQRVIEPESVPICLICVICVPMKKRLPMSVSMPGWAKPGR